MATPIFQRHPTTLPQVTGAIQNLERAVQRQRQESQFAQSRLEEFRDVLEVVKNTLGNGAGALARKRGENANLTAQIEEKRVNLETARRKYQASVGGFGPEVQSLSCTQCGRWGGLFLFHKIILVTLLVITCQIGHVHMVGNAKSEV